MDTSWYNDGTKHWTVILASRSILGVLIGCIFGGLSGIIVGPIGLLIPFLAYKLLGTATNLEILQGIIKSTPGIFILTCPAGRSLIY